MFLPNAAQIFYVNSYNKWLSGLLSEIKFWRTFMETKGLQWSAGFKEHVSPNKKFPLEEFISDNRVGEGYCCIDIGCGPFPIGRKTDKVKLNFQAVDPLGHVYNMLKKHYKINDGVSVKTGHVELLNELREVRKSTKGYEEVLKDYTERKKNFDTVYGEYLGSYQKRIMRTIRDGCKLELNGKFDEALKLYDAAIVEATANDAEISLAYIKRGNVYRMQGKNNLAAADFQKALALNNDAVGVHFVKAVMAESSGDKVQAAQEYRAFVKDADIVYYDVEIIAALDRIVELEEAN